MDQQEELLAKLISVEELKLLKQVLTDRDDNEILKTLIDYEE